MITVYSKTACRPCLILKGFLNKKNIYFEEKDVSIPEVMEELVSKYNIMSVPVTIIDDEPIIGPNLNAITQKLMLQ